MAQDQELMERPEALRLPVIPVMIERSSVQVARLARTAIFMALSALGVVK